MWETLWFSEIGIFEQFILCGILAGAVFCFFYRTNLKSFNLSSHKKDSHKLPYLEAALIISAVILRIILVKINPMPNYDFRVHIGWAENVYKFGISNVYAETPNLDYPPGYIIILWFLKAASVLFKAEQGSLIYALIYRIPAFVCDFLTAGMILKVTEDLVKNRRVALFLAATY